MMCRNSRNAVGGVVGMANKYKSLGHEMQRVIDLGLIDQWLRGLGDMVPRADMHDEDGFNTHLIAYDCVNTIEPAHIQALAGCRQLLDGCTRRNVAVEMDLLPDGHVVVAFRPEDNFNASRIFGMSYSNVRPVSFGAPAADSRQKR